MNSSIVVDKRDNEERRNYTFRTLRQTFSNPRRMKGRRSLDRRYPITDNIDVGAACLGIALIILSVLDSLFTLTIIANGGTEVNPFMNAVLQKSVTAFTVVKMLLTGIPAILLVVTANLLLFKRWRSRSILAALVGLYLGLIAYELLLLSMI